MSSDDPSTLYAKVTKRVRLKYPNPTLSTATPIATEGNMQNTSYSKCFSGFFVELFSTCSEDVHN